MGFEGKTAVITGAGSGFGEAILKRFAAEGANVIASDVDDENGARVVQEIENSQGRARYVHADVANEGDVSGLIKSAVDHFGGIDVLVNNAGFSHRSQPFWELDTAEYERVFDVNTKGVFLGMKHAAPIMIKAGGGVMVNTASIGAVSPRPGVTAYNATKGAVVTMTRGAAVELAPHKVRVNAVNPVAAPTGFFKGAMGVDTVPDEVRSMLEKTIPLGRLCTPEDVAEAVLFLSSDGAAFLTGVCLDVDGGRSIS